MHREHLVDVFPAYGKPGQHVFACACGTVGEPQPDVTAACEDGQSHLDDITEELINS